MTVDTQRRVLTRQEIGRIGMAARWGPRRHVDLRTLDPRVADVIRKLVAADEAARTARAAEEPDAGSDAA
jgi:hypothetical protein